MIPVKGLLILFLASCWLRCTVRNEFWWTGFRFGKSLMTVIYDIWWYWHQINILFAVVSINACKWIWILWLLVYFIYYRGDLFAVRGTKLCYRCGHGVEHYYSVELFCFVLHFAILVHRTDLKMIYFNQMPASYNALCAMYRWCHISATSKMPILYKISQKLEHTTTFTMANLIT